MSLLGKAANLAKIGLTHPKHGLIKDAKPKVLRNVNKETGEVTTTVVPKERLGNLYTGKKIHNGWGLAIGGAYLASKNGIENAKMQSITPIELATKNAVQYGAPDIMMYDGVGQERAPKNMNADGSIVFGLHNMRRG